jgi:hypothetical protein
VRESTEKKKRRRESTEKKKRAFDLFSMKTGMLWRASSSHFAGKEIEEKMGLELGARKPGHQLT